MIHFLLIHWWQILLTCLIAVGVGWCWRFGGSSHGIRFVRELGTGLGYVACLTLWFGWSWWVILLIGLSFIESTYFKAKGSDARWYNWLACGVLYALIPLPIVIAQHLHWGGFLIRCGILIPVITLWRTFQGDVQWSEAGAGVWQIITLPLLLI